MKKITASLIAMALGRRGGKARAKNLTASERSAIARLGGIARQARYRCETLLAGGHS